MNNYQILMDVGIKLFSSDYYSKYNVSKILAESGVSRGGFYHYFKTYQDYAMIVVAKQYTNYLSQLKEFVCIENGRLYEGALVFIKKLLNERNDHKQLIVNTLLINEMRIINGVSVEQLKIFDIGQIVEVVNFDSEFKQEKVEIAIDVIFNQIKIGFIRELDDKYIIESIERKLNAIELNESR